MVLKLLNQTKNKTDLVHKQMMVCDIEWIVECITVKTKLLFVNSQVDVTRFSCNKSVFCYIF